MFQFSTKQLQQYHLKKLQIHTFILYKPTFVGTILEYKRATTSLITWKLEILVFRHGLDKVSTIGCYTAPHKNANLPRVLFYGHLIVNRSKMLLYQSKQIRNHNIPKLALFVWKAIPIPPVSTPLQRRSVLRFSQTSYVSYATLRYPITCNNVDN